MELRHCNVYSCYMLKLYDEHYSVRHFGNEGQKNDFETALMERCPEIFLLTFFVVYQVATHSVSIVMAGHSEVWYLLLCEKHDYIYFSSIFYILDLQIHVSI